MADTALIAGQVLGGSCGAVAGSLIPGIVVLPSESAEATKLPLHVVRCVLEILVQYKFAERDGVGYTLRVLPPALVAIYQRNCQ